MQLIENTPRCHLLYIHTIEIMHAREGRKHKGRMQKTFPREKKRRVHQAGNDCVGFRTA